MAKPRQQNTNLVVCPQCGGFLIKGTENKLETNIELKCLHFLMNGKMCGWTLNIPKTAAIDFATAIAPHTKLLKTPLNLELYLDTYFVDTSPIKYGFIKKGDLSGQISIRCWDKNGHNYIFRGDSAKEIMLTQRRGIDFKCRVSFVTMLHNAKNSRKLKHSVSYTYTQFVKLVDIDKSCIVVPPANLFPTEYVKPQPQSTINTPHWQFPPAQAIILPSAGPFSSVDEEDIDQPIKF